MRASQEMLARIAEPERHARDRQRQMCSLCDQRDLRDLRALGAAQTSAQMVKKRSQRRGRYYFCSIPTLPCHLASTTARQMAFRLGARQRASHPDGLSRAAQYR